MAYHLYCLCLILFICRVPFLSAHSPSAQLPLQAPDFPALNDELALLDLHRELIEVPSVSGEEHAVGAWLQSYLASLNLTIERQTVPPLASHPDAAPRFNLLAFPGTHRDTRVLLTSHIDTVPPWIPYYVPRPHAANPAIRGRGANDDKAAVAAQVRAQAELLADGAIAPGDAALLFVVGEEIGGDGMQTVNELGLRWEAVVFGEPTELKLVTGHKGLLSFAVRATGKAAHSGYPWEGRSAISMLLPALAAIETMPIPGSEKLGPSTINIGRIEGGVASNVVPAEAMAGVSVRLAGASVDEAKRIVTETIAGVDERLEVEFLLEGYPPVDCDAMEGFETTTVNYGTDVVNLHGQHKRYLYGAGSIKTAHSEDEFVYKDDLLMAARGYKKLVLEALKASVS